MKIFLWLIVLFIPAAVLHLVVWRIRIPKQRLKSIALIFFGTAVALLSVILSQFDSSWAWSLNSYEALALGICWLPLVLAYTYSTYALDGESPTFQILRALAKHRSNGLKVSDLRSVVESNSFVESRLSEMIQAGWVRPKDERLWMTPKELLSIVFGWFLFFSPDGIESLRPGGS